jgi:hypothetical protein
VHAGRPEESWQVHEDSWVPLLTVLYVRDALGVVDPGGLPRLDGTGLPALEPADPATTWAWMRWWISTVEADRPGFAMLPELGDVMSSRIGRHLDSARTWAQVAHRAYQEREAAGRWHDLTIQAVVRDREAELGRRARPFRLRIEILPLVEPGLWWIADDAIAVDVAVRDEPVLYADALRPVIEQLA